MDAHDDNSDRFRNGRNFYARPQINLNFRGAAKPPQSQVSPSGTRDEEAVRKNTEALLAAIRENGTARDIEALVEAKDIGHNIRDENGNGLLHLAVRHNNLSALAVLINHGFDLHQKNADGITPLMSASVYQQTCPAAVMLADADPDLSAHTFEGVHVLHVAAERYGMTRLVEKLLQRGAPADVEDPNGRTPLFYALLMRNDCVEVICAAGGFRDKDMPMLKKALEKQDKYGKVWDYDCLLDHVSKLDRAQLLKNFPKQDAVLPRTPDWVTEAIFREVRGGGSFRMEQFDAAPSAYTAANHDGQSPLMVLLDQGDSWPARSIRYKSDHKARDNWGRTPLHYAVRRTDTGPLVEDGLWPENLAAADLMGRTPLMESVVHCSDYIETLAEEGSDLLHKDLLGLTAMDLAKIRRSDYAQERLQEALEKTGDRWQPPSGWAPR